MLKDRPPIQSRYEFVTNDALVYKNYLLRKVDKHIDFSFIHELVKGLYWANNGRSALAPTLMFKMILLGYSAATRQSLSN